jgi:hypothetical protein
MQVAEVLAVKGSKDVVAFLLLLGNVAEWACIRRELEAWQDPRRRICPYYSICSSDTHYWGMRSTLYDF